MNKLIVQIPAYNEEKTLPLVIKNIPHKIEGVDKIEVLVIDDGSVDNTYEIAKQEEVDHIIRFVQNKGLAEAFSAGLDKCLQEGAEVVVNIDADNQYSGEDIPKLIKPILNKEADIVVGDRQVNTVAHFSFLKRKLQSIGSCIVRHISGTEVTDTTSGFRAFSREAVLKTTVLSPFTYTLETIIGAGKKGLTIENVPVDVNPPKRKSRLYESIGQYIVKSVITMVRIFTMYQPLRTFFYVGVIVFLPGFLLGVRFLYYYFTGNGTGHIQSLILAAVLLIAGFMIIMIGLVADIISFNRKILEDSLYRIKKIEIEKKDEENIA